MPITIWGARVGAPDLLGHRTERNSKDSLIYLNILLCLCQALGTGDAEVDNTGRRPAFLDLTSGAGHNQAGLCWEVSS